MLKEGGVFFFQSVCAHYNHHLFILQIGGTYAKPVILPPEVAIGALGKIQVCSIFLLQIIVVFCVIFKPNKEMKTTVTFNLSLFLASCRFYPASTPRMRLWKHTSCTWAGLQITESLTGPQCVVSPTCGGLIWRTQPPWCWIWSRSSCL